MPSETDINLADLPYESGVIRFCYTRYLALDGTHLIRHGLFVAYHAIGVVSCEGRHIEGKENGVWRDFHVNGQPAYEANYHEGQEV